MRARAGFRPTLSSPLLARIMAMSTLASILAAAFLQGCDLFSTKELASRPADIRPFASSFTTEDTLRFRLTESLEDPAAPSPGLELARRILKFAKAPDSLQPGGDWIAVSVAVHSDPAGTYQDHGTILMRFDASGAAIRSRNSSSAGAGDTRYFPLKATASATGAAADTAEFLVLPSAFLPGADWVQVMGLLEVSRIIEDVDTLEYGQHLEESWRVSETVRGGGRTLAQGTFWYGESGLLKAEQVWDFEARGMDGSASAPRQLRREMARL